MVVSIQRQLAPRLGTACVLTAMLTLPALAGCESSQTKSARLERQAAAAAPAEQGLKIAAPSKTLSAATVTTLTGDQGVAAVVVEVEHSGDEPAFEIPILVTLRDDSGSEIFTNATPGLQRSLTTLASAAPGETTIWVNDQVPYAGQTGLKAEATIGDPTGSAPQPAVTFTTTTPELEEDPISGVAARGYVRHDGEAEQQRVLVTIVGRRGDEIVAAGRAIVERVKAGKRARFTAFLVGDPTGAELTATASPSLEEGEALAPEATETPAP